MGCEACLQFHTSACFINDKCIRFMDVALLLQHHMREEGLDIAARHNANPRLCEYQELRHLDRLPPRNPDFVGRAAEMGRLERLCFDGDGTLATISSSLFAGGGFGKTETVKEYAHRLRLQRYDGFVRWIDADQPAVAAQQLAELARKLHVAVDGRQQDDWVADFYHCLRHGPLKDKVWGK